MTESLGAETRGVSESASIAALVLLTVLVTASVGIGVLFVDSTDDGGVTASFSLDYFSSRAAVLITYQEGEELTASNLFVEAPADNISWATLRDLNGTATISPGARAQLNPSNAYGSRITNGANVTVVYVENGNQTVLDGWTVR
jgi:hypothetical protein